MRLVVLPIVLLLNFSLFSQNYKVSEIPPALLENANSVARLKQYDVTVSNVDEMKLVFHGVYTILNKNGREDFYPAVLYDKVNKVRSVELKVYDKNGEEHQIIITSQNRAVKVLEKIQVQLEQNI